MKKWKYVSMTAILGSAIFLAACGDDEAAETDAALELKHLKKTIQHN